LTPPAPKRILISVLPWVRQPALRKGRNHAPPQLFGPLAHSSGWSALINNTTGWGNTATGFSALTENTTGGANTATGSGALYHNTTGFYNTAFSLGT
jgi:hypothetical protein